MPNTQNGESMMQAGLEFMLEIVAIGNAAHDKGLSPEEGADLIEQHILKQKDAARLVAALTVTQDGIKRAQQILSLVALAQTLGIK